MTTLFSPCSFPLYQDSNSDGLSPSRALSPFRCIPPFGASTPTAPTLIPSSPSGQPNPALLTPSSLLLLSPSGLPCAALTSPTGAPTTSPAGAVPSQILFQVMPRMPLGMAPLSLKDQPLFFPAVSPKLSSLSSLTSIAEAATEESEDVDEKNKELSSIKSTPIVSPQVKTLGKKRLVRPPPLNVENRAACLEDSPVRLKLSAAKLCKFRKYTIELTIKRSQRLNADLAEAIIFAAMLNAKCCKDGSDVAVSCPRCGCQRVINVSATAQWPLYNEATDEETYSCTVQSKCSSSRDHLKSLLVLRIDSLPPSLGEIVSDPFVLLARDKGKGKRELAAERAILLGETPKKRKKLSDDQVATQALRNMQCSSPTRTAAQPAVILLPSVAQVSPAEHRSERVSSPTSLLEALVASSQEEDDDITEDASDVESSRASSATTPTSLVPSLPLSA